ncbi:hypothetical protein GOP47_0026905 [Adiantum capillus-veneris]|nr:hypothetical protein GOP47_0026905 [Adiantum capillus-veneris]
MQPQASLDQISCLLFKCRKLSRRQFALRLHAYMCQCGREAHSLLGNHLVCILADVRSMQLAHHVLEKSVHTNEQAWNSLILGYLKCGLPRHAIHLYHIMQEKNSVHPNKYTFVALLRACLNSNHFSACICIHAEIARLCLLEKDLLVGNTLVAVYIGYGLLLRAREVSDALPSRDVITWNVLMAAYSKLELHVEVLDCLDNMHLEGISPDSITFSRCIKACGSLEDKERGEELHNLIKRKGLLEGDHVVGSSLVDMYCKWGLLVDAQQVFDKLPLKDVVSWTILIQGYADHGYGEEALECFQQMQDLGIFPDAFTLASCLKACVNIGAADRGQKIHLQIEKQGLLEGDQVIGNTLVDLYGKCDLLADAQQVFDTLPVRDSVSWNALIAGYAEHGYDEDAITYFERMRGEGVFPDAITYVCLLKSCGRTGCLEKGRDVHTEIERRGLITKDFAIGNTIVDMYMRCGLLAKAQEVFDKLPFRDVVTWTILLAGYAEHGHGNEAMKCFKEMQLFGFPPDAVTLVSSLQACSKLRTLNTGHGLHVEIEKKGFLDRDARVGNALVNAYANFGLLAKAKQVFDIIPARDVVSWNILISGYAKYGCGDEALLCFNEMQREGVVLDTVTAISLLNACATIGASDKGRELHAEIERQGFLGKSLILSNSVINMYASCGRLGKAQQVFEELPFRDVVSWTILIGKYADLGCGEEALKYYEQMQAHGVSPDAVTFVSILSACINAGALRKGGAIHAEIERIVALKGNRFLGNKLVHMYARCGLLTNAQEIFDKLPIHDVITWNALIAGYAQFKEPKKVFCAVSRMLSEGIRPDWVTSATVCNTCRKLGLVRPLPERLIDFNVAEDLHSTMLFVQGDQIPFQLFNLKSSMVVESCPF